MRNEKARPSYHALARYYDLLSADMDKPAWTRHILALLQEHAPGAKRLAEAGCGTGWLSVALSKAGYTLLASDISPEMLEQAAKAARQAGEKILFSCQDAAALELPPVDGVIACCDVANYLPPAGIRSFFLKAAQALGPGGLLLFDVSSGEKLKTVLGNNLFYEDGEELTYFWQNTLHKDRVEMELTFFIKENGHYNREDEGHTQYIYEEEELLVLLQAAGFSPLPPKPHFLSGRIQFAAHKK